MGTDGACGLLFCAAKRSGAFPPNMPAGLRDGPRTARYRKARYDTAKNRSARHLIYNTRGTDLGNPSFFMEARKRQ